MNGKDTIQGTVIRFNVIQYAGRQITCWKNPMQAAVVPEPLDLSEHEGKVVELMGRMHGDLWEAEFVRVMLEDGYQEITGKVIGYNMVETRDEVIYCYRHGIVEAWYMPLNLMEYYGQTVRVSGDLH